MIISSYVSFKSLLVMRAVLASLTAEMCSERCNTANFTLLFLQRSSLTEKWEAESTFLFYFQQQVLRDSRVVLSELWEDMCVKRYPRVCFVWGNSCLFQECIAFLTRSVKAKWYCCKPVCLCETECMHTFKCLLHYSSDLPFWGKGLGLGF